MWDNWKMTSNFSTLINNQSVSCPVLVKVTGWNHRQTKAVIHTISETSSCVIKVLWLFVVGNVGSSTQDPYLIYQWVCSMEHLFSEIIDWGEGPGIGWERMHLTARRDREKWVTLHFIIFTLSVFAFFSCPHVGRSTIGTKSFDSASNSILSDGPTGYMTNRSSC